MQDTSLRKAFVGLFVLALNLAGATLTPAQSSPAPVSLSVDAREAPRRILHARLVIL